MFQTPIIDTLKSYKLWPMPEPLTELYFENHTKLPTTVTPGDPVSFSFTIHNIEYKPMEYPYQVRIEDPTEKQVATSGSVMLSHDGYTTINEQIDTTHISTRSAVVVDLFKQEQKIQFWIQPN